MTEFHDDVEIVDADVLIPYTNNAKEHPEEQVKKIASSIKNYGWDQPIVVDGENEIIKGHGRLQAAELLGLEQVPVITRTDLTDAEKKASRIADNKTAESAWIDDALETEIDVLAQDDSIDMESLGFDDDEIDDLLNQSEEQVQELEEEPLSDKALEDIKILNLYAGIGGNRKLWGDEPDVTAVEWNNQVADAYRDLHPDDEVIEDDAHEYLLDHYKEFDFIWASPPCPTHSRTQIMTVLNEDSNGKAKYPDMRLYQEIILLQNFAPENCKWVVENVTPYYEPLIEPEISDRHTFWANFEIPQVEIPSGEIIGGGAEVEVYEQKYGIDLSDHTFDKDYPKKKVYKNCVHPKLGKAVLESALNE